MVIYRMRKSSILAVFLTTALCSYAAQPENGLRINKQAIDSGLCIVIPKDADENIKSAAKTLQTFLAEIFDSQPAIKKTSDNILHQCIRLCVKDADTKNTLTEQGYSIQTCGNRLVITGGSSLGTLYGVYDFLENYLDCRWYTPEFQVIPKRDSLDLTAIDETYNPPLLYRAAYNVQTRGLTWNLRQKLNGKNAMYIPKDMPYDLNWHSLFVYLPPDKYFAEHPEYFAMIDGKRSNKGQICFANPDVRRIVSAAVMNRIETNKVFKIISVSQNEGAGYCQCEACQAIAAREGSQSGPLIDFVNYIADDVAKKYPDKKILTLAYQWSTNPPAHLKTRPNVIVQLCSINCAFNHPLNATVNKDFQKQIESWALMCNTLFIWDYTVNFWHLLAPHPNFNVLAPNVRFFLDHKVKGIFEEGNNSTKAGEFLELRSYLTAKVLWNPNVDTSKIIDDFLNGYYGPAGIFIHKYINRTHELVSDPAFNMGTFNGCSCALCKTNKKIQPSWSQDTIKEFVSLFDQAEAAVAQDKTLLQRVQNARIPLMYKQISGEYFNLCDGVDHDPEMTYGKLGELIDRFEATCRLAGVSRTCIFNDDDTGTFDVYMKGLRSWYAKKKQ